MARKPPAEVNQALEVHADTANPPLFRPVVSGPVPRIRTAKDAKKLYGRLISQFTQGEVASDDARTLAYLLSGFVQACAAADIENRIAALERSVVK